MLRFIFALLLLGLSPYLQASRSVDSILVRYANEVDTQQGPHKVPLNGASLDQMLAQYQQRPEVLWAEPNYWLSQTRLPNDPAFERQWAMFNPDGVDIEALSAWQQQRSSRNLVVAVIDSGIDYYHEDLADNLWVNTQEIAGNGIDDDNNGYVDDIFGISALRHNGDPMDTNRHGTHVAGIIGARGDNQTGITGVVWDLQILSCSFLDSDGYGTVEGAVTCIDYVIQQKARGQDIRIINASWGGSGQSQALKEAIARAGEVGISVVAAAGNDSKNADAYAHYPSGYALDNIISVASSDELDRLSAFSNFGFESVDLAAPGSGIYSTVPDDGYQYLSGTSMAAPMVSGSLALMLGVKPALTVSALHKALFDSCDRIETLADAVPEGRRLNLKSALAYADPVPGFRLKSEVQLLDLAQWQEAEASVSLVSRFGWQGEVSLSAELPTGMRIFFAQPQLSLDEDVEFTLSVDDSLTPGIYPITLMGTHLQHVEKLIIHVDVLPQGTRHFSFSYPGSVQIPDNDDRGVMLEVPVTLNADLWDAEVELDIAHMWRGDLVVDLILPNGERINLHDKQGGMQADLSKRFALKQLRGLNSFGVWRLHLVDDSPFGEGEIRGFVIKPRARITAPPTPIYPKHYHHNTPMPIEDRKTQVSRLFVPDQGQVLSLNLSLDIEHGWRNDLKVSLISPGGKVVIVQEARGGGASGLSLDNLNLVSMTNEALYGEWQLVIEDLSVMHVGQLNHWSLTLLSRDH